ncbi:hypothetical protein CC1G_10800 [Coprinopsis cinerea okayama7|uniref:Uncharacterized protein n=1 Tax=Coprinopsis cinerea (strain Okayama-7 / 130 / ATCC MYA-4618 / FGSC 9003) TaxID=240176 RepID=A8NMI9_COPC7|nr:hypothetical protein CC1G_10800 [Coprinopsis cinerea okayama7\|eukprot:XP_001834926.2 hypothetical protein CC1G_10800 [Coprinopsis cinerea okayama7\
MPERRSRAQRDECPCVKCDKDPLPLRRHDHETIGRHIRTYGISLDAVLPNIRITRKIQEAIDVRDALLVERNKREAERREAEIGARRGHGIMEDGGNQDIRIEGQGMEGNGGAVEMEENDMGERMDEDGDPEFSTSRTMEGDDSDNDSSGWETDVSLPQQPAHGPALARNESTPTIGTRIDDIPEINRFGAHDTEWTRVVFPFADVELEENKDQEEALNLGAAPAYARKESTPVRMAYLQAVLNNVISHSSVRHTNTNLEGSLNMLQAAGVLPDYPVPARTLATAKRRLGLDPDLWIINYTCCPKCWKLYTPSEMRSLPAPECPAPNCDEVLYKVKKNSKGKVKREAIKILPQVGLLASIRRMMCRPGFASMLRDSRDTPTNANDDPNFLMRDMHDGSIWHDLKTQIHRETGNLGSVRDVPGEGEAGPRRLTEHRFGLHMSVNIDWFGCFVNRPHSTGPVYIAFADLPREERFRQLNVICIAITPGPKEPTTEQLNNVMEPVVRDALSLKSGVKMGVYNDDTRAIDEHEVYADFTCDNCDTPGARKFAGFSSHSADMHPCPWCNCTSLDINDPKGYNTDTFELKDDFELLKHKFHSRDAVPARQATINENHGVRWAAFDWIPGWKPAKQTALDFMHCVFLGIVPWLFSTLLFGAHLFPGTGGENSSKQRFEKTINSIKWPSHITRLPKNLGENPSLKKADEWRRLLTVSPVVLWAAWKDHTDTIPDTEPRLGPNQTLKTTHCRRLKTLYDVIILLCTAVRLLSTKVISMNQAFQGQRYLAAYCQRLLQLGAHLSPNHHFAMHLADMIKLFGPVYGWWLYAFERFNGLLKRVKTNGHDGGRVELTLMRNWLLAHLLYELSLHLPDDASPFERALLNDIINSEATRGGMAVELAILRAEATADSVRVPVAIEAIFLLKIPNTELPSNVCLLVRRLKDAEDLPVELPWQPYSSVLGITTSRANDYGDYEIVTAGTIDCP